MPVIYCIASPFLAEVCIQDENGHNVIHVPVEQLEKEFAGICLSYNAKKVHFFGDSTYLEGIIYTIKSNNFTYIEQENIEIEVN